MKSEKFKIILESVVTNLLFDIIAGHGNELIEVPYDEKASNSVKECLSELAQFWGGNTAVTRYDLFASILGYCANDDALVPKIAGDLVEFYPENETKLTSSSIIDWVNESFSSPFATTTPLKDASSAFASNKESASALVKTTARSSQSAEYKEMIEAKKAVSEERESIKK